MDELLTDADVRVLGALIEKEITTPDHYPLSLNALVSACNQSSNRNPIVAFDDAIVLDAIRHLRHQSLLRAIQHAGSRVMKYEQLATDALNLSANELGVLCVLMLRGPNTIAELRTRTERLAKFESLADVEATLNALIERSPAPLVTRLARQPGQKEVRYAHLLAGEVTYSTPDAPPPAVRAPSDDRFAALEEGVRELRAEVADLRTQLAEFRKQFE